MEFMGYKREDGRYGVRNYVLVISSVSCANGVADAIGRAVPEAVVITHGYGCGFGSREDYTTCLNVLTGLGNNPNVGAVLVVGLGCEGLNSGTIAGKIKDKPVKTLVVQEDGGSKVTTEKGTKIVREFKEELDKQERVAVPVSELVVGLECGGSDALSGITANPSVGNAADRLVQEGATVILGETTEMIGTAHILKRRGATAEIGKQIEELVNDQERQVKEALGERAGMVIAPGNIEGGLSSITEKSLGCIMKAGTTPVNQVVKYAEKPEKKGLIIMDTPGYDIDSMAAFAAGGAQIIVFTTGRGSVAGFPAVPVIKVSSNSRTYERMPGDMDVNAGSIVDEGKTLQDVGEEIYRLVVNVANGKETCAENNRSVPFNYLKTGPTF